MSPYHPPCFPTVQCLAVPCADLVTLIQPLLVFLFPFRELGWGIKHSWPESTIQVVRRECSQKYVIRK